MIRHINIKDCIVNVAITYHQSKSDRSAEHHYRWDLCCCNPFEIFSAAIFLPQAGTTKQYITKYLLQITINLCCDPGSLVAYWMSEHRKRGRWRQNDLRLIFATFARAPGYRKRKSVLRGRDPITMVMRQGLNYHVILILLLCVMKRQNTSGIPVIPTRKRSWEAGQCIRIQRATKWKGTMTSNRRTKNEIQIKKCEEPEIEREWR